MFGSDVGGCYDSICIPDVRYNTETDQIERSFDGGATWEPAPDLDPRHSIIFQYPPVDAEDPRCQAAANMVRWINDLIDQVLLIIDAAGTFEGLVAIIMPLLLPLGPFGVLIDLVLGLAFVLFGAGAIAIASAFDNTAYDTLTCIFNDNIEPDGSVTEADLAAILSDIDDQLDGLVFDVLTAAFFLMGEVGLSNAGTLGDAPADCSACEWCITVDLTDNDGGFTAFNNGTYTYGTWVDGQGWQSTFFPSPGFMNVQAGVICLDLGGTFQLHQIGWEYVGGVMTNNTGELYSECLSSLEQSGSPWTGDEAWDNLAIYVQSYPDVGGGNPMYITAVSLRGVGDMPTLTGWVECP